MWSRVGSDWVFRLRLIFCYRSEVCPASHRSSCNKPLPPTGFCVKVTRLYVTNGLKGRHMGEIVRESCRNVLTEIKMRIWLQQSVPWDRVLITWNLTWSSPVSKWVCHYRYDYEYHCNFGVERFDSLGFISLQDCYMDVLRPCAAHNYNTCVREVHKQILGSSTPANFELIKACSYIVAIGDDTAKCSFQQVEKNNNREISYIPSKPLLPLQVLQRLKKPSRYVSFALFAMYIVWLCPQRSKDFYLQQKQATQSFLSQFLCISCANYERAPPSFLQCGRQCCGAQESLLFLQAAHKGHLCMSWSMNDLTRCVDGLLCTYSRVCRQHFSIVCSRLFLSFIGTATLVNRGIERRKWSAWLKMYQKRKTQALKLIVSQPQLQCLPWKLLNDLHRLCAITSCAWINYKRIILHDFH